MVAVATRFGKHVYLCALMAIFCGVNTRLNFELLNGINRGKRDVGIKVHVHVVDAVESVVIIKDALAAGGYSLLSALAALA